MTGDAGASGRASRPAAGVATGRRPWLGRRILLENPSTYVAFEHCEMDEIAFLTAVAKATAPLARRTISATEPGHDPGRVCSRWFVMLGDLRRGRNYNDDQGFAE